MAYTSQTPQPQKRDNSRKKSKKKKKKKKKDFLAFVTVVCVASLTHFLKRTQHCPDQDLKSSHTPAELEIRPFEQKSESTVHNGTGVNIQFKPFFKNKKHATVRNA